MSKTRGIVLDAEATLLEPASLVDMSRYRNDGVFTNLTMAQLPSGLWIYRCPNGATARVNCGDDASVNQAGDFSVEIWVYLNNTPTAWEGPFGKINWAANWKGWGFFHWAGDYEKMGFLVGDGTTPSYLLAQPFTLTTWQHWLVTRSGNDWVMYLNGSSVDSATIATFALSATDLYVGRSATYYYDGDLALPHMYTYALNASQVRSKFNETRGWFGV